MSAPEKTQPQKSKKIRLLPNPTKAQPFKQALAATNKQFAETLARLAK